MNSIARRMFELVEPIGAIPYSADEPNEAMTASRIGASVLAKS
jgi:hypothetical protein